MKQSRIFEVYEERKRLFTRNLTPGLSVYQEKLIKDKNIEYREWNPKRSKLAALIMKGCRNVFLRKGDTVLYLGAASGTTTSHVSDIVGEEGLIFALEFSPNVLRKLVYVAMERKNIAPILADASKPRDYVHRISGVDVVYQDIAQRSQAKAFLDNCRLFLKPGGYGILAVKSRSIDIAKRPKVVFKDVRKEIEQEMTVVDYKELDPLERDHCMFICKRSLD